jgi:MFS family permease
VAQLAVAIAAAWLVERRGRRPIMLAGTILVALATLGFAAADQVAVLVLARTLQGAGAGLVWTAAIAAIADVYPSGELGFRIGLAETVGGATGLAAPAIGGVAIDAIGTGPTFAIAALFPAALAPLLLWVPETGRAGAARYSILAASRRLMRHPAAQAGAVGLAAAAGALALLEPLLPLDLDSRLGFSSTQVGLLFAVGTATYLAAAPASGRWSDRRGRPLPILTGGLVLAATLPLVAVGPGWWVTIAFAAVGAGIAGLGAPSGAVVVESVDLAGLSGMYGLSAGVVNVVWAGGSACGPLLAGAARAVAPFWVTVLIAAALVLACTLWAYARLRGFAPRPMSAGQEAA